MSNRQVRLPALTVIAALAYSSITVAQNFSIDSLEVDGTWCPMAHCNRYDDSYQEITPLLTVGAVQKITDPRVSPSAWLFLGCVTGEAMAVCAYNSPDFPALVAYDYENGSVRWTSPLEDLPEVNDGVNGRRAAGILLAKMGVNGNPVRRYAFAANRAEFVAYAAQSGVRVWKRANSQVTPQAPEGIGLPVSITFNDEKELVTITKEGWIVKLNPVNGSTIDAYKMDTRVFVNDVLYRGTFVTTNSPAVVGNTLYAVVEFRPDESNPLDPNLRPVHVIRVELNQPEVLGMEHKIKALVTPDSPSDPTPDRAAIGVGSAGGSPPVMTTADGKVLIFADADAIVDSQRWPAIVGVQDDGGMLQLKWRAVLDSVPGDDILAAPALHFLTRTLLVNTRNNLYVFREVDTLTGSLTPPPPLFTQDLISCGTDGEAATVTGGAPLGLAFNRGTYEIVAYTNFRVTPSPEAETFGYLGAFAIPAKGSVTARSLWCSPLATTEFGEPAPGRGTAGQPALFLTDSGNDLIPNLIVNTFSTGTFIFRSATSTSQKLGELADLVSSTPTAMDLIANGYQLRNGSMLWADGCPDDQPGCTRFVNNPITRYGQAFLPAGERGGFTTRLRLDGKDAFVLYGLTPPAITYYSHTMNQFRQFYPHLNDYFNTVSSISLSINHSNINTLEGPHDSFFAVVVAADHGVANDVHRSLVEAGVPEAVISRILIPERFANKDSTPIPDELTFVTRLTFRTLGEKQRVEDYIAQPVATNRLLFFDAPGGSGNVVDAHLPKWEEHLRVERSEINSGIDSDLDLLVNNIIAQFQSEGFTLRAIGTENLTHVDPQAQCRDVVKSCNFDAPDALYARFFCPDSETGVCLHILPNNKDFFVVAGVNHHRYANNTLGSYFSYAVTRFADLAGVVTFIDLRTLGSAAPYLQGTAVDPANLFAMKISRACNGDPYCLEVPWGLDGIPQFDLFMLTARIYLDSITGTAPNPENFVPARILWFVK